MKSSAPLHGASQVGATPTHCAVLPPCRELASCVRVYVTRSTVGASLEDFERHNFYPASLACSISWTLQGQTELLRVGSQVVNAMATSAVMFSGPQTQPCETRNPGAVEFFLLMFMPDAFYALTGIDLHAHTNRHSPLHEVLGTEWQSMANAVMAAQDDSQRVQIIELFLQPLWKAARPLDRVLSSHFLADWMRSISIRTVVSQKSRGLRQMERNIKRWTGQTQRQLLRMVRGETAYLHARTLKARGDLVWSDVASEMGFSDQSHLCREFYKLTGLQPEKVLSNIEHDERLWIYKAW